MRIVEIVVAVCAMALVSAAQTDLYGIDLAANLYEIDKATGTATLVGNAGIASNGRAFAAGPNDRLYYMGTPGVVYEIDRDTAAASIALITTIPPGPLVRGMAFDGVGDLYVEVLAGPPGGPGQLWRVDFTTGAATLAPGTSPPMIEGLAWDAGAGAFLTYDAIGATLYEIATNGGVNAAIPVLGGGSTHTLEVDADGSIFSAGLALRVIDRAAGTATLIGSFGAAIDIYGLAVLPDPPPAYPGNGSDVAVDVAINGVIQNGIPGVHATSVTDFVSLAFGSPGGTLTFTPFLAFWQLFTTGNPPPFIPAAGLFFDFSLVTGVIADGLSNPAQVLNPVLGGFIVVGTLPPALAGINASVLVNCLTIDLSILPYNFGIANAQELRVN